MEQKTEKILMDTRFSYLEAEPSWLQEWQKTNLGSLDPSGENPFVMVIPPPNITGSLHVGHALDNILPDCLIRYHMSRGRSALRVPGTDHAGIAAQFVVEKHLKSQGIDRNSLSRDEFEAILKDWAQKTKTNILDQLVKMGCLMDFSRARFTMDEICSKAVKHAFKKLFDQGLIYQGDRLISWCVRCRSALSDLELEWSNTRGRLYYLKYPLEGGGDVTVATTRPETMLGDAAVAVNPSDERYAGLKGRFVLLPLANRRIPVVFDHRIESGFGTGVVKVTPGHDPLDWAIGADHQLEIFKIIAEDGTLSGAAGVYKGLTLAQARKKVLEDLQTQELLIKEESHQHNVAVCYRCGQVVEPLISKQWFMKMETLRDLALEAYEKRQEPKFYPQHWGELYHSWLKNLRDWCLSRQIIWGHRIPVWHCRSPKSKVQSPKLDKNMSSQDIGHWPLDIGQFPACPPICSEETPTNCPSCGGGQLEQDPDVLDTWFSSSLWPMSVFGWPEKTSDFERFYPTSLMVNGYDITYLWVARMVMMGFHFTGKAPFKEVYLHGLVRDTQGRKMSKSLGNVIDPSVIQKEHGTDALRFGLMMAMQPGRDIYLSKDSFVSAQNFNTKLWNASRFILQEISKIEKLSLVKKDLTEMASWAHPADYWIIAELNRAIEALHREMARLDPAAALREIYDAFWGSFCDWYLEISKLRRHEPRYQNVVSLMKEILEDFLAALGPFVPFVSQEIWRHFKTAGSDQKFTELPPAPQEWVLDRALLDQGRRWARDVQELVAEIRSLRADLALPPAQIVDVYWKGDSQASLAESDTPLVEGLAKCRFVTAQKRPVEIRRVVAQGRLELIVYPGADWSASAEMEKFRQELKGLEQSVARVEQLLSNEGFVKKAPPEVIVQERDRLFGYKNRKVKLADYLKQLESVS